MKETTLQAQTDSESLQMIMNIQRGLLHVCAFYLQRYVWAREGLFWHKDAVWAEDTPFYTPAVGWGGAVLKHCPGSSDLHTRTWPSERSHHTSRCSWDENAFDLKQVFHNLSCTHTHTSVFSHFFSVISRLKAWKRQEIGHYLSDSNILILSVSLCVGVRLSLRILSFESLRIECLLFCTDYQLPLSFTIVTKESLGEDVKPCLHQHLRTPGANCCNSLESYKIVGCSPPPFPKIRRFHELLDDLTGIFF